MRTKLAATTVVVLIAAAVATVAALGAGTKSIKVGDNYFVRKGAAPTVTVKKGTTVRWVWKGKAPHNVYVTAGPQKFDSGAPAVRDKLRKRLKERGTYTIICTIHAGDGMVMKLRVT